MEEERNEEKRPMLNFKPGPLGFHVISIIGMAYYGIMAILFFIGFFYSSLIYKIILTYDQATAFSLSSIRAFATGGFLVFGLCALAIILMILKKSWAYYLFLVPAILIIILELFVVELDWLSLGIDILFIMLFSVQFRKIHLPFE